MSFYCICSYLHVFNQTYGTKHLEMFELDIFSNSLVNLQDGMSNTNACDSSSTNNTSISPGNAKRNLNYS